MDEMDEQGMEQGERVELYSLQGLRSVRSARMGPCDGPLQDRRTGYDYEAAVGAYTEPVSCPLSAPPVRPESVGVGRSARSESAPHSAVLANDRL